MEFSNHTDEIRMKSVALLDKLLENVKLSRNIEKSIYNKTIQKSKEKNIKRYWTNIVFKNLYISKIRSIYSNLDKECYIKNSDFIDKVKSGEIEINKISSLSPYDIYPDNWKELFAKKAKQDKLKYELKPEAMTDSFKCRKCGSRSCSYYEVQTRSADEPMTQFITCLDCNNRWKQ